MVLPPRHTERSVFTSQAAVARWSEAQTQSAIYGQAQQAVGSAVNIVASSFRRLVASPLCPGWTWQEEMKGQRQCEWQQLWQPMCNVSGSWQWLKTNSHQTYSPQNQAAGKHWEMVWCVVFSFPVETWTSLAALDDGNNFRFQNWSQTFGCLLNCILWL